MEWCLVFYTDYRTTAGGLSTKRWQKTWWATNKKHQSTKKRKQISPSKFVSRSKLPNRISVNMFNQFTVSKMERMGKYLEKLLKRSILLPRLKKKKFYKSIWIPRSIMPIHVASKEMKRDSWIHSIKFPVQPQIFINFLSVLFIMKVITITEEMLKGSKLKDTTHHC